MRCFSDFFYDVMYITGYNGKVAHVNYQAQFCDKRRICFAVGNKDKTPKNVDLQELSFSEGHFKTEKKGVCSCK